MQNKTRIHDRHQWQRLQLHNRLHECVVVFSPSVGRWSILQATTTIGQNKQSIFSQSNAHRLDFILAMVLLWFQARSKAKEIQNQAWMWLKIDETLITFRCGLVSSSSSASAPFLILLIRLIRKCSIIIFNWNHLFQSRKETINSSIRSHLTAHLFRWESTVPHRYHSIVLLSQWPNMIKIIICDAIFRADDEVICYFILFFLVKYYLIHVPSKL